jgi:DNA-binding FadR family transcriptional regulator
MIRDHLHSEFLHYLIDEEVAVGERLPPLTELSEQLGVSVGKLREQLEVARALQIVSVRPRVGIRRESYQFAPAMLNSLLFGLATGDAHFAQYSALRQAVETSFWHEAVRLLTDDDRAQLQRLVDQAWHKLRNAPVHIPRAEHRELHLTIFKRLDNPFVKGILTAYWEAYAASEMTRFVDYSYWVEVWQYHEQIVAALVNGDEEEGRRLLVEHFTLLRSVPAGALPAGDPGHPGNGAATA